MLSKMQMKFLKYLSGKKRNSEEVMSFLNKNGLNQKPFLTDIRHYVDFDKDENGKILSTINQKGNAELEAHKRYIYSEIRYWITTVIAVLAFVLSIISLALQ